MCGGGGGGGGGVTYMCREERQVLGLMFRKFWKLDARRGTFG